MGSSNSLYLKNTTVTLLLIVPLLLAIVGLISGNGGREENGADQPPIIVLSEAEGFTFKSGSAEISSEFAVALRSSVAAIVKELADRYGCDVVEVIGHTDGQVVRSSSNLDSTLAGAIRGSGEALSPGSNADLGLMRAWAVVDVLKEQPELDGLRLVGYSAGHVIDLGGNYSTQDDFTDRPERRRIEIRVRRSPEAEPPAGNEVGGTR